SMSPHPESHTYLTAADLADPNKRMPINPDRGCLGGGACAPGLKYLEDFTREYEGYTLLPYIPGVYLVEKDPDGVHQIPKPIKGLFLDQERKVVDWAVFDRNLHKIKHSGVTIDTGYDLGQHSEYDVRNAARAYIREKGALPAGMNLEDLIGRLRPFFARGPGKALEGRAAMEALVAKPEFALSDQEAEFLRDTHIFRDAPTVAGQYQEKQRNGVGNFYQLPAEVQTTIIDWTWAFGTKDDSDHTRAFWQHVYRGEWAQLRRELESNTLDVGPNRAYQSVDYVRRRRALGALLGKALDRGWPENGGAC
ncbi:pesticin C-terminus-like muramidase, partial [Acidithiobacillus caldus]